MKKITSKEYKNFGKIPGSLKVRLVLMGLLILAASLALGGIFSSQYLKSQRNREIIAVQNRYINFQDQLEDLMYKSANLIKGYEIFRTHDIDMDLKQSENFLKSLMEGYDHYIRNVGIIEDTTIVFNYPYEENQSTIGYNLLDNKDQKEDVLRVKNEMVTILVGPVDLVQGGEGYIIRTPLPLKDGQYWGQASIVLSAPAINEEILNMAERSRLEIVIYNDSEKPQLIVGNPDILQMEPITFQNTEDSKWLIYAIPKGGWSKSDTYSNLFLICGGIAGLVLAYAFTINEINKYHMMYAMTHDALTGLYNRNYLKMIKEGMTKKIEAGQGSYGMLLIDIDGFKSINDQYGHGTGDEVLAQIGGILKSVVRNEESLIRVGGDEFLILVSEVDEEIELQQMRNRFMNELISTFQTDQRLSTLGASIGIYLYSDPEIDFEKAFHSADMDMYTQKSIHKTK